MKYLTGILCYNVPCEEDSIGIWGVPREDWADDKLEIAESDDSPLKDWGIECDKIIPYHDEFTLYNVATHTRSYLDSLIAGRFDDIRNIFYETIVSSECRYTIFCKVCDKVIQELPNYKEICNFMTSEFGSSWISFVSQLMSE